MECLSCGANMLAARLAERVPGARDPNVPTGRRGGK